MYSYIFEDSPIYSYIFLYLEDSPIPIFHCKQEMLNSYLKQMWLISNMERCKFVILQHLLLKVQM